MRKVIAPRRLFIPSTHIGVLPIHEHDYIRMNCHNGEAFVLDVTGAQLGLEDWLYPAREYNAFVWHAVFQPVNSLQDQLGERVKEYCVQSDPGVLRLKKEVLGVVEEWQRGFEADATKEEECEGMYNTLAVAVGQKVREVMASWVEVDE
jgi:hypothetical protein